MFPSSFHDLRISSEWWHSTASPSKGSSRCICRVVVRSPTENYKKKHFQKPANDLRNHVIIIYYEVNVTMSTFSEMSWSDHIFFAGHL